MAVKKIKRRGRKALTWQGQILGLAMLLMAVVFMPTTIVLLLGMTPTIVAAVIDRSGKGVKALTVGAMNAAGCTPFLIRLWTEGHSTELAVSLITDPLAISIMYAAAGVGYLIDWAMSGIVGTIMFQRSSQRIKEIKRRQEDLISRWGVEVTGELPLDPYGFPLDVPDLEEKKPRAKK